MFLYASKLIDQPTYSKMMEVKEYRNTLVHLEPFTEPKIQPKEAKDVIRKAITCIEQLLKIPDNEDLEELIKFPPKPESKQKETLEN